MGAHSSKGKAVQAMSVAELLPDDVDAGETNGIVMSDRVLNFEWVDSIAPLADMDPHWLGPTKKSPAKVELGNGYTLCAAALPTGEQKKYHSANGSVTLSLANAGQVALQNASGHRVCILKKKIDTQLLKAGTAPWEVYSIDGKGAQLVYNGMTYRKCAHISYDKSSKTFSYTENNEAKWIARGSYSKLKPSNPLFNADGATFKTSVANMKVHNAKSNTLIAIFSGAMKGPKHIRIAKNSDLAGLICFALASTYWWDDNKVAQINVASAVAMYMLGAG
uniref:Uncharacterized protein n=1 Tax=Aureoumbra lagunensis TaxID=44058 RepID=A0A7S3K1A9_9STRA|mmetsp:Transcript_15606/g.20627  ORF Transcript_15606/g.20627 Transcript_15606/m.20627 type:complete len:278 (+) Transcript_15606:96-929(+)|eukprot:CAMPEP_0197353382 /NCGR_PEP_ID=MMETSP0893-20130614/39337_1 /TAXON_ID=44058 ORGANISM="Aureoumbra lagunensis, Strain CCMP1510" /NCGR_SAMPLE_ID=MMETSP0893 /ASSEMBLY_ACC=CAM_ASM_000539 /LENGTH=277 /DNA_ID=CAMNT_0042868623 /DNA_START=91 /DNA_END=924 /DNA_ORIENTATION=+